MVNLESLIRDVPDFPKPGIVFKDVLPVLADPAACRQAVDEMIAPFRDAGVDVVVGIESRGFLFGALAARELGVGFVAARKPGKLPGKTVRKDYELEYGTDAIEMQAGAVRPGQTALMVDDLLATGGTMAAACELVREGGAEIVGVTFLIELDFLHGREKLSEYDVRSLIHVE
jgi:adenine phosphoribosyltransferase